MREKTRQSVGSYIWSLTVCFCVFFLFPFLRMHNLEKYMFQTPLFARSRRVAPSLHYTSEDVELIAVLLLELLEVGLCDLA